MSDPKPVELVTLSLVLHEVRRGNERITRVEESMDDVRGELAELSGRVMRNSSHVKQPSSHDLTTSKEVAELKGQVEALAANDARQNEELAEQTKMLTEVKDAVVGTITNPKVRFVGKVLFGIAVAYSAAHGLKVLP